MHVRKRKLVRARNKSSFSARISYQCSQDYEEKWEFAMCAGAIDGTHVLIIEPADSNMEYAYRIWDVVIGWLGSIHEHRFLWEVGNDLVKEIGGVEIAFFLFGDPAYPILPWLIEGYPRKEVTDGKFNYNLSRARMTLENTFRRWKGRFTRFSKRLDMKVVTVML